MLIAIATLLLASCGKTNGDEPKPQTVADKTIFVFMPFSGDSYSLYYNFLTNIGDMEKAIAQNGGLGKNRLVVFIAKDKNKADLIDITYNGKRCLRDTIATYNSPTYTSIEGRTALFNQVKLSAPAKKYAMIVGCHGEGWLPVDKTQRKAATRFFGGATADYQIEITDFATSLSNAGMKLQFLLFDDCYLSCMEVAYDLRNVTDHVIASTSEIMAYGMPYQRIFGYLLQAEPDYSAVCSEFLDFYNNYDMPFGAIGVTDCSYAAQMADIMKGINATHTLDSSKLDKIQDLDAAHFEPTVYFDFGDYVRNLCGDDSGTYEQFKQVLAKLVPYKACTKRIYSYSGRKAIAVDAFSGITISDPSVNEKVIETKKATNWWKVTHN